MESTGNFPAQRLPPVANIHRIEQLQQIVLESEREIEEILSGSCSTISSASCSNNNSSFQSQQWIPLTSPSMEDLLTQFNALVKPDLIDRSVAEFLLDTCGRDVASAIAFYRAQQIQEEQRLQGGTCCRSRSGGSGGNNNPICQGTLLPPKESSCCDRESLPTHRVVLAPSPRRRIPRRHKSLDSSMFPQPSSALRRRGQNFQSPPRRQKSFDVAEAPSVTVPFSRHSNRFVAPSVTNTRVIDIPRSRQLPVYGDMGRSKSERHFFRDVVTTKVGDNTMDPALRSLSGSTCHHLGRSSSSNGSGSMRQIVQEQLRRNQHNNDRLMPRRSLHASWRAHEYDASAPGMVTSPPTATMTKCSTSSLSGSSRSLGRNLSGRHLQPCDPSAKAA